MIQICSYNHSSKAFLGMFKRYAFMLDGTTCFKVNLMAHMFYLNFVRGSFVMHQHNNKISQSCHVTFKTCTYLKSVYFYLLRQNILIENMLQCACVGVCVCVVVVVVCVCVCVCVCALYFFFYVSWTCVFLVLRNLQKLFSRSRFNSLTIKFSRLPL